MDTRLLLGTLSFVHVPKQKNWDSLSSHHFRMTHIQRHTCMCQLANILTYVSALCIGGKGAGTVTKKKEREQIHVHVGCLLGAKVPW